MPNLNKEETEKLSCKGKECKFNNDILSLSYKDVLNITESVSENILSSSFSPDVFLAVGTGGLIPAKILKNFMTNLLLSQKYLSMNI